MFEILQAIHVPFSSCNAFDGGGTNTNKPTISSHSSWIVAVSWNALAGVRSHWRHGDARGESQSTGKSSNREVVEQQRT